MSYLYKRQQLQGWSLTFLSHRLELFVQWQSTPTGIFQVWVVLDPINLLHDHRDYKKGLHALTKDLWNAAAKGRLAAVITLLADQHTDLDQITNGVTPLYIAAQEGYAEVVSALSLDEYIALLRTILD
jgi:hypothetical protein